MARLIVRFPDDVVVMVDGAPAGRTNRVISSAAGEHVVRLEGAETQPSELTVVAPPGDAIVELAFARPEVSVDRFSPLYCAYNGFLLGQFMMLSFAEYGREDYPVRRSRMLEFLSEVAVTADVPDDPAGLGSEGQIRLLETALPQLQAHSRPLAAFTLLGALLTNYGIIAESDPDTAQDEIAVIEDIRAELELPAIERSRFIVGRDGGGVERTLSPSLAYLSEIVDRLAVEPETAFVIMPFATPYAAYFSTFYRPALEGAGFRAFRAWGGLGTEDYGVLLLKLIEKSGMVWADVSEPNSNVFYEVGAAHAFGKLSMLVVDEDHADQIPANIGHDAVVRYSAAADDWPSGTVALTSMLIAALHAAAQAGERLRVTPDAVGTALERVAQQVARLASPEAHDAAATVTRSSRPTTSRVRTNHSTTG